MSSWVEDLVQALEEHLPPMPPKDAMCHVGICTQEKCLHCGRVARGHDVLRRAQGILRGDLLP